MKKHLIGIAFIAFVLLSFKMESNNTVYLISKTDVSENTNLQQLSNGKLVYNKVCIACHQMNGAGIPGTFPPLSKSDYLNADVNRAIKQVLNGSVGPITVNGKKYVTPMPKQVLSDQQIADVLTYVYANWGNNKSVVTPEMVKAIRK